MIPFSDLQGKVTDFGRFISEELITRLFITQKFDVVERQLLNKVLDEHKLTATGIVDERSAKELGRILGVDAIASGTITDLRTIVKVNARLISTETGSLFAVAAVEIAKDETVKELMAKTISTSRKSSQKSTTDMQHASTSNAGDAFFKEDFSSYEIGDPASSWGSNVVVLSKGNKKYLTTQIVGQHVIGQKVNFPKNFSFGFTQIGCRHPSEESLVFIDSKDDELVIRFSISCGIS